MHKIGFQEEKEKNNEAQKLYEWMMTENFLKLMKGFNRKPQEIQ